MRIAHTCLSLLVALSFSGSIHAEEKKPKVNSVADFAACVDRENWDTDTCVAALKIFLAAHPAETFAAGKAVRLKVNHAAAIPYFARALARSTDAKKCADADVLMALTAAFALPTDAKDLLGAARAVADKCWAETNASLIKELNSESNGYFADNFCAVLTEKKIDNAGCHKTGAAAPTPAPAWVDLDTKKIQVEEPAKVYVGSENQKVTVVHVKGEEGVVLLAFENVRGPWNHKVILHREIPAGTGFDYVNQSGGQENHSFIARKNYGSDYSYEMFPTGDKDSYHVSYSDKESKETTAQSILKQMRPAH